MRRYCREYLQALAHWTSALTVVAATLAVVVVSAAARASRAERTRRISFIWKWSES